VWGKGLAVATLFCFVSVVFLIVAVLIVFRSRMAIRSVARASSDEYERKILDLEAVE